MPDDASVPSVADLLAMIREGTYDVPALASRLGLSESHVRLLLSAVAKEDDGTVS